MRTLASSNAMRRPRARCPVFKLPTAALAATMLFGPAAPAAQSVHPQHGGESVMTLSISSTAFSDRGEIPSPYTCDGKDLSPALSWSGVPEAACSLALIVDDPDAPDPAAPKMTWVHWVLYNIPSDAPGLPEAVSSAALPAGTLQGVNDWKRTGYGGPCPPIGRHRYFFKLYALDAKLPALHSPTKKALEKAMHGHVLAEAQWVGTYQRSR
jgi:Raf kinase inhibitor-like YbhB/YbcL family protein